MTNNKHLHLHHNTTSIHLDLTQTLGDVELIDEIITFHINNDLIHNTTAYTIMENIATELSNRNNLCLRIDYNASNRR